MQSWWILRVALMNTVWEVTLCACGPMVESTVGPICFSWDTCFGDKASMLWGSQADHILMRKNCILYPNTQWDFNWQPASTNLPDTWMKHVEGRSPRFQSKFSKILHVMSQRAEISHFHASLTKFQFMRKTNCCFFNHQQDNKPGVVYYVAVDFQHNF